MIVRETRKQRDYLCQQDAVLGNKRASARLRYEIRYEPERDTIRNTIRLTIRYELLIGDCWWILKNTDFIDELFGPPETEKHTNSLDVRTTKHELFTNNTYYPSVYACITTSSSAENGALISSATASNSSWLRSDVCRSTETPHCHYNCVNWAPLARRLAVAGGKDAVLCSLQAVLHDGMSAEERCPISCTGRPSPRRQKRPSPVTEGLEGCRTHHAATPSRQGRRLTCDVQRGGRGVWEPHWPTGRGRPLQPRSSPSTVATRDVIFRKISNQNHTDTNETPTTKTKYQTDFYAAENTNILPNFNTESSQNTDKIPRKYQEIWDRNTKYRFGFRIFLVYQIFGYRLTSLVATVPRNAVVSRQIPHIGNGNRRLVRNRQTLFVRIVFFYWKTTWDWLARGVFSIVCTMCVPTYYYHVTVSDISVQ